jgi:hypothetical protein
VGEGDHVQLADADTRRLQAGPDRLVGKRLGMALAVEALLLGEGDDTPVCEQASGGVVAEAVDPEDVHLTAPFDGRAPRFVVRSAILPTRSLFFDHRDPEIVSQIDNVRRT